MKKSIILSIVLMLVPGVAWSFSFLHKHMTPVVSPSSTCSVHSLLPIEIQSKCEHEQNWSKSKEIKTKGSIDFKCRKDKTRFVRYKYLNYPGAWHSLKVESNDSEIKIKLHLE